MDTIFEIKIKSLEITADKQSLRVLLDGSQIFKIGHAELRSLIMLAVAKVKQLQAPKETD